MALRALLFAVFGGFIGAAPAAPVVAGSAGSCAPKQTQKSERPGGEVSERPASDVAAAPPSAGAPPSDAGAPLASVPKPPRPIVALALSGHAGPVARPVADIRAGRLGLPPPAR